MSPLQCVMVYVEVTIMSTVVAFKYNTYLFVFNIYYFLLTGSVIKFQVV